jgi:hypothetical protein
VRDAARDAQAEEARDALAEHEAHPLSFGGRVVPDVHEHHENAVRSRYGPHARPFAVEVERFDGARFDLDLVILKIQKATTPRRFRQTV